MLKNDLKLRIMQRGLQSGDFAKLRGVSRNTISNWVTGKSNPTLEEAFDIAEYFGVTVTDIWRKENTEKDIKKEGH